MLLLMRTEGVCENGSAALLKSRMITFFELRLARVPRKVEGKVHRQTSGGENGSFGPWLQLE